MLEESGVNVQQATASHAGGCRVRTQRWLMLFFLIELHTPTHPNFMNAEKSTPLIDRAKCCLGALAEIHYHHHYY